MAVIGSLVSSAYSNGVDGSLDALPPQAQAAAAKSVGGAGAVAAHLPGDAGSRLLDAAGSSFADAMGIGLLVAAGVALLAAVLVARALPGRAQPASPVETSRTASTRA